MRAMASSHPCPARTVRREAPGPPALLAARRAGFRPYHALPLALGLILQRILTR